MEVAGPLGTPLGLAQRKRGLPLGLALGSPIFPSGCEGTLGVSLQSCLTLCDPIDGSPPGSPVPGILQARTLEWIAISFSSA